MAACRQLGVLGLLALAQSPLARAGPIFKVPLFKDSVPVYRHGVIKSYKTAYLGEVTVGNPPQKLTTIFDTGSGQVILPLAECVTSSCQSHRVYNASASTTAAHINEGGDVPKDTRVVAGADRDQTRVRFGTGDIEGVFVRDTVCIVAPDLPSLKAGSLATRSRPNCVEMHVLGAYHMSDEPFKFFRFDGVIGLGLASLAVTPQFSFFEVLSAGMPATAKPHFGIFLTKVDGGQSEISFGGHDPDRLASDLFWTQVPQKYRDMGHWLVPIRRVMANGLPLESCEAGDCLAIVDTGCTALGVPREVRPWLFERLALRLEGAGPEVTCRDSPAPEIEFDLGGFSVVLDNSDYYKRRPLVVDGHMRAEINGTLQEAHQPPLEMQSADEAPSPEPAEAGLSRAEAAADFERRAAQRFTVCQPSLLPVPAVPPFQKGKFFIFGEPVLRKYYTTFDWRDLQVGFALARQPEASGAPPLDGLPGAPPTDVQV